ncbi:MULTISPECIES: molecular chaperone [unclassified Acinetobacter]|uniref:fimbrial biogenesis chaperone n=1 Tax=unclassified Acinetobacter TaxID=196816 RepID=UPI002934FF11|nr:MULTISPECIES: fimbria/pilus periplasmic chaperone [unclassified Acinetobacter]WOE31663.1 fimbria/pilus periplasmic chaperone [Acinetobacter sp. SAAs470]WOE37128.1 fimbria/pilus periplasmic chaperone [Acinetobacter sp. SAAs474]
MHPFSKSLTIFCFIVPSLSYASLSLDRTRVIYNEQDKAISLNISNSSEKLPYLAQAWLENDQGQKIDQPFAVTPPIQRIEPKQPSQIKLEKLKNVQLPQDRESVYYFNFRAIPPKSDKPNVMQLSIQTKIKVFYRPKALYVDGTAINNHPWQQQLILKQTNQGLIASNPTPYYITIIGISEDKNTEAFEGFKSFMVAPFSDLSLNINQQKIGKTPFLTYLDDYGGKQKMRFNCSNQSCSIQK